MINFIVFVVLLAVGEFISAGIYHGDPALGTICAILAFFFALIVAMAIRIANQWERAVILRLGEYSRTKGPGLFFIIPVIDQAIMIDTRILTLDIPKQQAITKDNVPVSINGVVYFKVEKSEDAVIKVQNYAYAMSQYAQATLRDVIGGMTLDQLLAEREQIGKEIEAIVERESSNWGLKVSTIKIMDIDMPEELKKMMSRQASAEREKRATITKAEGDKMAAINLSAAAETMAKSPGAMQLRTLQTIDGLGPSPSNTVVLAVPVEFMEAIKKIAGKLASTA
jgi:regulator of protease activity HflC (stomatin/prohibitin superfamily)